MRAKVCLSVFLSCKSLQVAGRKELHPITLLDLLQLTLHIACHILDAINERNHYALGW